MEEANTTAQRDRKFRKIKVIVGLFLCYVAFTEDLTRSKERLNLRHENKAILDASENKLLQSNGGVEEEEDDKKNNVNGLSRDENVLEEEKNISILRNLTDVYTGTFLIDSNQVPKQQLQYDNTDNNNNNKNSVRLVVAKPSQQNKEEGKSFPIAFFNQTADKNLKLIIKQCWEGEIPGVYHLTGQLQLKSAPVSPTRLLNLDDSQEEEEEEEIPAVIKAEESKKVKFHGIYVPSRGLVKLITFSTPDLNAKKLPRMGVHFETTNRTVYFSSMYRATLHALSKSGEVESTFCELDLTAAPLPQRPPVLSLSGTVTCNEQRGNVGNVRFISRNLPIDSAVEAAGWFSLYCEVETLVSFTMVIRHFRNAIMNVSPESSNDFVKTSISMLLLLTVADVYYALSLVISTEALGEAGEDGMQATNFLMAAFLKSLASLGYFIIMFGVWLGRRRVFSDGNQSDREAFREAWSKVQFFCVGGLVVLKVITRYNVFALGVVYASFWVPQILANIKGDHVHWFSQPFLLWFSFFRIASLVVLYSSTFVDVLIEAERIQLDVGVTRVHSPTTAMALVALVASQALVLWLQQKHGARFFVPGFLQPPKFDYHDFEYSKEIDCVVCMTVVQKQDAVMTPCAHVFHEECLKRWAVVKLNCPTCRSPLPSMTTAAHVVVG